MTFVSIRTCLPMCAMGLLVGLVGCSSDATGTSTTGAGADGTTGATGTESSITVPVAATEFATLAPSTIAPPPTTIAAPIPGSIIDTESTYTIVSGDYPSTVATRFAVSLDDLLAANNLTLTGGQVPEWPLPGTVIKIPAGAKVPGEPPATTTLAGDTATATTTVTATTVASCTGGTYVIQEGDAPSLVARKFDTTVDELSTVNAETPGYSGFIVGITIKIPDKTIDC